MALGIGLSVQASQDTLSQDLWTERPYPRAMVENRELQFNEALCARVHRLRTQSGKTAEEMATALGIPAERYRKYEYRSPLPHYLIEPFAIILSRDVEYILTGRTTRRVSHLQEVAKPKENRRKQA